MHILRGLTILLLLAGVARAESIRVGAAISLREAFAGIAKTYQADTGDTVEFVFGSSGQIAQQIKSGAPMDAFVSAAVKQVDDLAKDGFVDPLTRRDVAGNRLVLVVSPLSSFRPTSLADLKNAAFARIAIGEPKTVPAGQYAQQSFTALKLDEALKDKIVYGTNVRQVLAYVERGEAFAGLVYTTDAIEATEKVSVALTVDDKTHEPIVYPAAVVTKSAHAAAAKRFLDYLAGEKARAALSARGFTLPAAGPAKP
ncbi:MAG TPA: molybdate ABC transporter substrate-binding protein [Tepidisphaeraceae bacterium]|jgi:molybdate transport system substrate-binding protein